MDAATQEHGFGVLRQEKSTLLAPSFACSGTRTDASDAVQLVGKRLWLESYASDAVHLGEKRQVVAIIEFKLNLRNIRETANFAY